MDFLFSDNHGANHSFGSGVYSETHEDFKKARDYLQARISGSKDFRGVSYQYLPLSKDSGIPEFDQAAAFGCLASVSLNRNDSGALRNSSAPMGFFSSFPMQDLQINPAGFIGAASLIAPFAKDPLMKGESFKILQSRFEAFLSEGTEESDPCTFGDFPMSSLELSQAFFENHSTMIYAALNSLILSNFTKPIALIASEEELPLLVKKLISLLPTELAKFLSFNTLYSGGSANAFLILGLTPELEKIAPKRESFSLASPLPDETSLTPFVRFLIEEPSASVSRESARFSFGEGEEQIYQALLEKKEYSRYLYFLAFNPQDSSMAKPSLSLAKDWAGSLKKEERRDNPLYGALFEPYLTNPTIPLSSEESSFLIEEMLSFAISSRNRGLYLRLVDRLLGVIVSSDDGRMSLTLYGLLKRLLSDETTTLLLPTLYHVIPESPYSGLDNLVSSLRSALEENENSRNYLGDFFTFLVSLFRKQAQDKKEEKAREFLKELFGYCASSLALKLPHKILLDALKSSSLEENYCSLSILLEAGGRLPFENPDVFYEDIVRAIRAFVQNPEHFSMNVALYQDLLARKVNAEKLVWLAPFLVKEATTMDEVYERNEALLTQSENQAVDPLLVHRLRVVSVNFLVHHEELITHENAERLHRYFVFYSNQDFTPESNEEFLKADAEVAELINRLGAERNAMSDSMLSLSKVGEFTEANVAFLAKTEGLKPAPKAQGFLLSRKKDKVWLGLFLYLFLSIGFLVPFYFFAPSKWPYALPMIAVSGAVSVWALIHFRTFDGKKKRLYLLLANVFAVFIPLTIADILLVVFYFL